MTDPHSWDPMDPNSKPPIRKPGEVWIFVLGVGWTCLGDNLDSVIIHGEKPDGLATKPPSGILNSSELTLKGSWVTPPLKTEELFSLFPPMDPNSIVAKIKADWLAAAAPHLDPLWMVKAMGLPLHYCAPAPRLWTDYMIFRALGSDTPVTHIILLGDLDIVDAELAAEFGETAPLLELRAPIAPAPAPWVIPEDDEFQSPGPGSPWAPS